MINITNKKFWNIFKGIGILSIVIGHSCEFLIIFVYSFHLVIFFFLGGYTYSEEKYGDDPYLLLTSRLKNNWTKYVYFTIFFNLIHNKLLNLGLIYNTKYYLLKNIITNCLNSMLFKRTESLAGGLWFVPTYIFASTIFGTIIYFSRIMKKKYNIHPSIIILSGSIISCLTANYLIKRRIVLDFRTQISLLVMPFFMLGYYLRKKIKDLSQILNIFIFIICSCLLSYTSFKQHYFINFSKNSIGGALWKFIFISLIGIYFCLYVAKLINKTSKISKLFCLMGEYSFEIMATHFLIFKIIDYTVNIPNIVKGNINPRYYRKFPYAYKTFWPIYITFGTLIPTFFFHSIKMIRENKISSEKIK